jgi:Domain of unknown function (DUF4416)
MGDVQPPPRCLLLFGLLLSEGHDAAAVHGRLGEEFGEPLAVSDIWPFDFTDYYEPEMGSNLRRQFAAVMADFDPGRLAEIKLRTNALEEEMAQGRQRRVNIDPGYLTLAKLVLASTKEHSHRVSLGQGIFGEVTLVFHRREGFEPMPWTYPDYRDERVQEWLSRLRESLRRASG